ncbi:MAG: class II fumarate hydratase [Proteobacteria bacterium]|nr:class II fumarate hydratase [Pseudomonadota bacterium]
MSETRTERDALGEVNIPSDALWGSSTQRALENFPVSGRRMPRQIIWALGLIKAKAALVNGRLGLVDEAHARQIADAANEVAEGAHDAQFPLDVFQTGSGTSTNMNANEVIANLANIALGGAAGEYRPVHPNDHVNRCQSSNDVIPSAIHLAAAGEIDRELVPALEELRASLASKARAFDGIVKTGRTHLMDAMPVRLGQEFGGYARQIEKAIERLRRLMPALCELALGGTAVGTGFGAHPDFAPEVCALLSEDLGLDFRPAKDRFEALSSRSTCAEAAGSLAATATSMTRIADDLRLMASGPRLGIGEITLPPVQPGSSIMPGKVNPVIPEMVTQVGAQVIANGTAVSIAAQAGHLELSTMLPLIAANLTESISILAGAARAFARRCVAGIEACDEICSRDIEQSLALATALAPKLGYSAAAEIAKEASLSDRTIREVALEQGVADEAELDEMLDAMRLTTNE